MKSDYIDQIVAEAMEEISHARYFKQGKIGNWQLNEEMYFGKKRSTDGSSFNVQLNRMQESINTLLSKTDNPLVFRFLKRKNAQERRIELLNSLVTFDRQRDHWDIKDLLGKKQAYIYGRAAFSYHASSDNGRYRPHLELVDVHNFLIDPAVNGLEMESAFNMGSYDVVLTEKDLKDGIRTKKFIKDRTRELLESGGNADESSQEDTNKLDRTYAQGTTTKKEMSNKGKFKFWRWYTTYKGTRYYLLLTNGDSCIRCEETADVLPTSKEYEQGLWPYFSYAAFPDATEFWTPSYSDILREIFMAQDANINQILENTERHNKPQKAINVNAIDNPQDLKYRRDGFIRIKGDVDVNKAVQILHVPSIDVPLRVMEMLEQLAEKTTGITGGAKGVEDTEGKVGIYEGNQQNAADRFGLLNKSISFGYERMAELYEMNVRKHLNRTESIQISGPSGVSVRDVKKSDLFRVDDDYGVLIEASDAEKMNDLRTRAERERFFTSYVNIPIVNQKKLFELRGKNINLDKVQVDELLDTESYGSENVISDVEADMEAVIDGEFLKPNPKASIAYVQRFKSIMEDDMSKYKQDEWERLTAYLQATMTVAVQNASSALVKQASPVPDTAMDQGQPQMQPPEVPPMEQASQPTNF